MGSFIDLAGQRFSRLKVISLNHMDSKWGAVWNCLCDCGKEIFVRVGHLRSGDTKSCGCLQRERSSKTSFIDLTGQKFGKLEIIYFDKISSGRTYWNCFCECGN